MLPAVGLTSPVAQLHLSCLYGPWQGGIVAHFGRMEHHHSRPSFSLLIEEGRHAPPPFGLSVIGWEQVEGLDSPSLSVPGSGDSCEGSSQYREWDFSRSQTLVFLVEEWMASLSPSASCMPFSRRQVAAVVSPLSVTMPVGDSLAPIKTKDNRMLLS